MQPEVNQVTETAEAQNPVGGEGGSGSASLQMRRECAGTAGHLTVWGLQLQGGISRDERKPSGIGFSLEVFKTESTVGCSFLSFQVASIKLGLELASHATRL